MASTADAKPPVNPESIHVQSGTVAEEAHNLNVDTEILARMTEEDVREAASVAADAAENQSQNRAGSNSEILASGEAYSDPRDRDHAVDALWPDLGIDAQS